MRSQHGHEGQPVNADLAEDRTNTGRVARAECDQRPERLQHVREVVPRGQGLGLVQLPAQLI